VDAEAAEGPGAGELRAAPVDRRPDEPGGVFVGVANNHVTVLIIMWGGNHWPRFFMGSRRLEGGDLLSGIVEMVEMPEATRFLASGVRGSRAPSTGTEPDGRVSAGAS
jgi:hypothetical protein